MDELRVAEHRRRQPRPLHLLERHRLRLGRLGLEPPGGHLEPPEVARLGVHLGEHLVERPQQPARVVGQQHLVVRRERRPADQLAGQQAPRAEVVAAVPARPRARDRPGEPLELAGRQLAVGEHEHVGVPGQLRDVGHDVVVDQAVGVVEREQAGPPWAGRAAWSPGGATGGGAAAARGAGRRAR